MKADQAVMSRRLASTSQWVASAFALLTLGACGQTADPSSDDGASNVSQGGSGQGGGSPNGGLSGASPTGGNAPTGGSSGTGPTGGASGNGFGGTGQGGASGSAGTPATGGAAGAPGGAPNGGVAGAGMAGAGAGGAAGSAAGSSGTSGSGGSAACPLRPIGWAALPGGGFNAPTSGGCNATPVTATNLSQLQTALTGFTNKVVRLQGNVTGSIVVNANTTLEGVNGARITGSVVIDGAINVILRNLTIVGNNCADADPCEDGADAVSINGGAHHVWVDHCDISNGSDGNLDVVDAGDFVTVSWTKFSYSGTSRDHRFSNLIGDGDGESADAGKLGVTFHHCWWADRIEERMPRVRYGRVHLFNNLWTASGNDQTVEVGYNANVRLENNVFIGVTNPINSSDYNPGSATVTSTGNQYSSTSGSNADRGTAWTPNSVSGYTYTLEATNTVEAAVRNGAGPE